MSLVRARPISWPFFLLCVCCCYVLGSGQRRGRPDVSEAIQSKRNQIKIKKRGPWKKRPAKCVTRTGLQMIRNKSGKIVCRLVAEEETCYCCAVDNGRRAGRRRAASQREARKGPDASARPSVPSQPWAAVSCCAVSPLVHGQQVEDA